jgi:hypothetical protein
LEISQGRSLLQLVQQRGVRHIFVIESEYGLAMLEAELAWTRKLADEIRSGALGDLADWNAAHLAMDQRAAESQEDAAHEQHQQHDHVREYAEHADDHD